MASEGSFDLVRRGYEAFNRGGAGAVRDFLDPEIEYHEDPGFPEAGVYRGRDAVLAYFESFGEQFEAHVFEIEELIDAGDVFEGGENVLMLARQRVVGKGSGAEIELAGSFIWTVRDGRVVRGQAWLDREEALKAAGLQE